MNYYLNIKARSSHTLAPLTKITSSKLKFKWTKIKKNAFEEIKRIVARDTLLAYPDFNEEFKIHTDARNFQLVIVMSQTGKPIAFYSGKLTDSQKGYTATET